MERQISRKEWLERRRKYIGGSDAAAALGISRFRSRLQLCQDKWGELEDKPTEVMERGLILEPVVAAIYQYETDHRVGPAPWIASEEYPWMAATPDLHDYDLDAHVQIKTASAWGRHKWGESGSSEMPDDYRIQGQHEMAVTGAKENVFAVLFADESTFRGLVWMAKAGLPVKTMVGFVNQLRRMEGSKCEFAVYPLKRDDELIKMVIEGERRFWEDFVVPHVLPPDKSVPEKRTDIITASATQAAVIQQLRDARDALDAAEEKVEQLTEHVKTMIGDNAGITAHGIGKVTYKAPKPQTTVDYKTVAEKMRDYDPEVYNLLLKKHTKAAKTSRAFRMYWAK